jgi:hypothetical protein
MRRIKSFSPLGRLIDSIDQNRLSDRGDFSPGAEPLNLPRHPARIAALAPALLLLAAAADSPIAQGLWETRNTPGVATLDGRPLAELPLGEIKTDKLCLSRKAAADPVRFFARDLDRGCTIASGKASGGKVRIQGTCPNQLEGPDGTFLLTGRYNRHSYTIHFATTAVGDNGKMTFSGKMTGRRVAACPAG